MNKPYPYHSTPWPGRSRSRVAARSSGAADFLRSHSKMASLLPAVARMLALQKDCTSFLPAMFQHCEVLRIESGLLLLAVPNTALASKLKQQLPKLQEQLSQRGWQVTSIRLKVQVKQEVVKEIERRELFLPATAIQAFAELEHNLPDEKANHDLKKALRALLEKRR